MRILTPEQMREVDRLSTTPTLILMENAGMRVVEVLEDRFENLDELTIAIFCGKGNNGGDGMVVARQLIQKGVFPFVFLFASEEEIKGDAKANLDMLKGLGYPPTIVLNEHDWAEERLELLDADIVVDALLGTGARKPVEGLYKLVIESLAEDFPRAEIVAVDVPSPGVQADVTVTFTALKPTLVFYPESEDAGDVILADIGCPAELLVNENHKLHLVQPHELPARVADSNKGTYGRVLVIGGASDTETVLKAVLEPRGTTVQRSRTHHVVCQPVTTTSPEVVVIDMDAEPEAVSLTDRWRQSHRVLIGTDQPPVIASKERFLSKPFQYPELVQVIEELLNFRPAV